VNPANESKREPLRRRLPGLAKKDGFLPHPFDRANGVRTGGLVAGRHLRTGHAHDRHVTAYYGVAPSVFHALLARWRKTRHAALNQTTFVDIGAGMGRAVLLAAELPFREVLGVELHPALVRIARLNLAVWRKAGRSRCPAGIVTQDAVDFSFPPGPCVAFLFNPFGAVVMRRWLRAVTDAFSGRPGELDILYVNNEQEGVFEDRRNVLNRSRDCTVPQPNLVRIFLGQIKRSRVDRLADDWILSNQPDGEYASAPHEDCSIWRWLA
jgi:SAM-dependent methyltransferase